MLLILPSPQNYTHFDMTDLCSMLASHIRLCKQPGHKNKNKNKKPQDACAWPVQSCRKEVVKVTPVTHLSLWRLETLVLFGNLSVHMAL
jgi:hypothetical protein